jgi:hypothetical protein
MDQGDQDEEYGSELGNGGGVPTLLDGENQNRCDNVGPRTAGLAGRGHVGLPALGDRLETQHS